jgi:hypothetical protein
MRWKTLLLWLAPPACLFLVVWLLVFHGLWRDHLSARSPDGTRVVESRILYKWRPIYGWSLYYVRVLPETRIRCISRNKRWRGTPSSIHEWQFEHMYARYNDFDERGRFPESLRWVSDHEFVIEGGEGSGARFEVER